MPDQRPAPLGRHRPEGIEVGTRSAVPAGRGQPACLRRGRQPDRHGTEKRADAPVPRMARRLFRPPCRSGTRRARALFASRHRRIRPLAALPGQHLYRRLIRPPPSARAPYPLLFVRLGSTLRPAPQKSARRGSRGTKRSDFQSVVLQEDRNIAPCSEPASGSCSNRSGT